MARKEITFEDVTHVMNHANLENWTDEQINYYWLPFHYWYCSLYTGNFKTGSVELFHYLQSFISYLHGIGWIKKRRRGGLDGTSIGPEFLKDLDTEPPAVQESVIEIGDTEMVTPHE